MYVYVISNTRTHRIGCYYGCYYPITNDQLMCMTRYDYFIGLTKGERNELFVKENLDVYFVLIRVVLQLVLVIMSICSVNCLMFGIDHRTHLPITTKQ